MQEWLTAGDGNDGRSALFCRGPALLWRQVAAQNFGRELNFSAAGAGEVAAEEGLEHEHQRIALNAAQALPEDVGGDGEGLGQWRHQECRRSEEHTSELQ